MAHHARLAAAAETLRRSTPVRAPWLLLAVSLITGGCALSAHRDADPDQPAVLIEQDAAARAELARAVSEALNGVPVRLADDALTRNSELIIERTQRLDTAGRPILGRSTERPEHFQLIERAGRCILIHERTAGRWPLRSARCAPARAQR